MIQTAKNAKSAKDLSSFLIESLSGLCVLRG